jgi:predicted RND superfamily exporter protein
VSDAEPNIYGRLARFAIDHAAPIWVVALILTAVLGVIGIPPRVDPNMLALLPDSDPSVQALQRINREEGGLNVLSITYKAEDPAKLDPFLDDLVTKLEALPEVNFAMHELDPSLAKHIGLLQFKPEELEQLNIRLKGALALGPALNPMVTQKLMDMGPLTERIAKASGSALLADKGDGTGRVIIRPTKASSDPEFCKHLMEEVEKVMAAANPAAQGIRVLWIGGAYRHSAEDVQGVKQDLAVTNTASLVVVLVVLSWAFRSVKTTLLMFPPILIANVWTLGLAALTIGTINTYTSFGTATLLGLSVDFAVHLVARFRENRASGLEPKEAVIAAWDHAGPPSSTAALTSAAGFLALATARFQGFVQLGYMLSVGLLLCFTCVMVLMPSLLVRFDHGTRMLLGLDVKRKPSRATYALAPHGVVAMMVGTIGVLVFIVPRIGFEYDISAMRRDGMSYSELSDQERKLARESYAPVVIFYDQEPEKLQADEERLSALVRAGGLPHVAGVFSIKNVLPDDQAARNEQIRDLVHMLDNPAMRYLPPVLIKRLLPLRGLQVDELTREDLPEALLTLMGANNENAPRMMLLPKGNMWDVREAGQLAVELQQALPGRQIAGESLGISSLFTLALEDAPKVGGLAFFLVAILVAWDLRRPAWVAWALTALSAGLVWSFGLIWLFGVKFSMINLTGIPIAVGIGVDTVVHLLHRLEEEGPGGIRRALMTSGAASALSTITTAGAFLSLGFATNRGVRSLGVVVVIGEIVVTLAAAFLLPLIWSATWRLQGRAPGQQPEFEMIPAEDATGTMDAPQAASHGADSEEP